MSSREFCRISSCKLQCRKGLDSQLDEINRDHYNRDPEQGAMAERPDIEWRSQVDVFQTAKASSKHLLGEGRIVRYLLTLFLVGSGISIGALIISREMALGILIGVLISILPQSYFVLQAFRISAAVDPQRAYFSMMRGESGKFLLTAALFALLFKFWPDISAPVVFTGFVVMLVTQIIGSVLLLEKKHAE